ncbi:glycosyl transferase [Lacrimispora saccharolytica]|nr:glycosyl transferase [Lacrimispora saccharolytica]
MGRKLNLKNPKEYNEKLQWLKLNDRKPEYSTMVDKYEVRGYIEDLLGDKYLIPCLGIYDSVDDIDIDALPNRFVLKCTHDSGSVEICKDKSSFDIEGARHRLSQAMKRNYYATYREWPYKYVKPRIIAEGCLEGDGGDLKDYKVMCFNGEAKIVEVHENRFVEGKVHTQTFYDKEWNIVPLTQVETVTVDRPGERPRQLDEIIRLSELIAKDMYHARIDWYIEGDKIYFGEITFFDGSGFESFSTPEMERMLGDMIKLPEKWKE